MHSLLCLFRFSSNSSFPYCKILLQMKDRALLFLNTPWLHVHIIIKENSNLPILSLLQYWYCSPNTLLIFYNISRLLKYYFIHTIFFQWPAKILNNWDLFIMLIWNEPLLPSIYLIFDSNPRLACELYNYLYVKIKLFHNTLLLVNNPIK